jgi:hypothetical protein
MQQARFTRTSLTKHGCMNNPNPLSHFQNVPNASTPLKTLPMNPKTLTKHIVPLHILGSNPTTPKYVNRIGCKKGPTTFCSSRSTWVKRQYSSTHKTMVETTKKESKLLTKSFHKIHASSMAT